MDFTLCEVTFGKVDTCHCQHALANVVHIPSYVSKVQHVQISEYFIIKNYMKIKYLDQFFYYHSKYSNSMKCLEIVWVHLNAQSSVSLEFWLGFTATNGHPAMTSAKMSSTSPANQPASPASKSYGLVGKVQIWYCCILAGRSDF